MKRFLWIFSLVIVAGILGLFFYLKFVLPNVGPAPEIKVEITPGRLERGKYLATTVMGCIDCHSHRDFSKFAGPLTGTPFSGSTEEFTEETGMPGNFYPANLTPYFLGDWTDGEIYRAITAGVTKDGRALFPVMPYHLFGQASQEDIFSILAYLRTLPSHENDIPKSEPKFPINLLINTMPHKTKHREIPDKNNIVKYGEYMITIAACIDCHTPMDKGKPVMEEAYSGGMEFFMPDGIVRSANITPDEETGIGGWTEEIFVDYFKTYNDSTFTPYDVDGGFNTAMPWTMYANMDEYDLKAIFAYLKSLKPINKVVIKYTPNQK